MKLLMLNYEFPPLCGGASPSSYEYARELVSLGHEVDVVTRRYAGLPKFESGHKMIRPIWRAVINGADSIGSPTEYLEYNVLSQRHGTGNGIDGADSAPK